MGCEIDAKRATTISIVLSQFFLLIVVIGIWASCSKIHSDVKGGTRFSVAWDSLTFLLFLVFSLVAHFGPRRAQYYTAVNLGLSYVLCLHFLMQFGLESMSGLIQELPLLR